MLTLLTLHAHTCTHLVHFIQIAVNKVSRLSRDSGFLVLSQQAFRKTLTNLKANIQNLS